MDTANLCWDPTLWGTKNLPDEDGLGDLGKVSLTGIITFHL